MSVQLVYSLPHPLCTLVLACICAQTEKAHNQRLLAEATSRHQQELAHLREEVRGSERLRQLANGNWREEKEVLMNIIRQLTQTITMDTSYKKPVPQSVKSSPRYGQKLPSVY